MRCCHSTNRAPSSHKSVSDSGSEMGVTVSAQVRSDAVSMSACSFLTSADVSHQVACTRASAVRDEEAAGSNPATPTSSKGLRTLTPDITCARHISIRYSRNSWALRTTADVGTHRSIPCVKRLLSN